MRTASALLTAGLLMATASAAAQDIDYADSRIGFTFKQMNVPVEGGFKRFRAQVLFDRARPEKSHAEIEVDLASIDTGSTDGDNESQRRAWLDTASHPTAKFVSSAVRRVGPDRFEARGTMTIKGRAHELTAPFEVRGTGTRIVFEGAFTLKRLEFAVGEGQWADTDTVADEVQIRFHIAQAATGPKP